jgi:hypothetical protein
VIENLKKLWKVFSRRVFCYKNGFINHTFVEYQIKLFKMETLQKRFKVEEAQSRVIETMIANYENTSKSHEELIVSLNDPDLYPDVRKFTEECIKLVSLALDDMWNEIMLAQQKHMKTIKKTTSAIKK